MKPGTPRIHRGLVGVVADVTAISEVNERTNSLLYRGFRVDELADQLSFEQVAWLLWHGDLPTDSELGGFRERIEPLQILPDLVNDLLDNLPRSAHPMDATRSAISLLGAIDPLAEDDSAESEMAKAEHLFAAVPAIVAGIQRRRFGLEPLKPRTGKGYVENFLWMSFGREMAPVVMDAFKVSMVLYAEHSFNASTFTARVITSTLADMHSAVVGAIGALKGPLHGGANEAVMEMFEEIGFGTGAVTRARGWLHDALQSRRKIMGFGHRVYKNGDSRVPAMNIALENLIRHYERPEVLELYHFVEQEMGRMRGIEPNLDFPSGPAYHLMGFDTSIFTPLFVASRVTGWCAHVMEQRANNALIRPLSGYNGAPHRSID